MLDAVSASAGGDSTRPAAWAMPNSSPVPKNQAAAPARWRTTTPVPLAPNVFATHHQAATPTPRLRSAINPSMPRRAALAMVQQLAANKRACRRLGWRTDVVQHRVAPVVQELERAQPALAPKDTPCLEYPWENPEGAVRWPAEHLPLLRWFKAKEGDAGMMLFRFANDLCTKFDDLFP